MILSETLKLFFVLLLTLTSFKCYYLPGIHLRIWEKPLRIPDITFEIPVFVPLIPLIPGSRSSGFRRTGHQSGENLYLSLHRVKNIKE